MRPGHPIRFRGALSPARSYGKTRPLVGGPPPSALSPAMSPAMGVAGIALLAGILVVPTFVIVPWIVKGFAPEWSYGRRVAVGLGVSFIAGTLTTIATGGRE